MNNLWMHVLRVFAWVEGGEVVAWSKFKYSQHFDGRKFMLAKAMIELPQRRNAADFQHPANACFNCTTLR